MSSTKKYSVPENQSKVLQNDVFEDVFTSSQNASLIEKRHQQIVNGACKIFFKKGYHPTTTREIAKECGMSIGQLYHYISSKDDVLYLVHKYIQKIWYDYLKKADIEHIDDPMEKLTAALHHSLEFMIENKKFIQFIYSESKYLNKKYLQIVLDLDYKNVIGFWRNLLEEVNRKKPVNGDLNFVSSVITYLLAFLALRDWTLKDTQRDKHVDFLIDFIIKGMGIVS